jgi:DNA-binding CsgD family transcriptional regulator
MKRPLHDLIHVAADVCAETDATHTEVAENVLGMTRNQHRRWRRKGLREEGEYKGHEKDDERLRSLTEWLAGRDALPAEYEYLLDGEPYSGPADAEDDPFQVAREDIFSVSVSGDSPSFSDLTDRERYVVSELQTGATPEGLAEDLGTRESVVRQHMKDLRRQGVGVRADESAEHFYVEGEDHALRSSEAKQTRTRHANEWWERRHNALVRNFRSLTLPDTELPQSGGREDWVTHMTDTHAGDRVRMPDGTVAYSTADIPATIDYVTRQSLALARHHNAEYDAAHLVWGGDMVTNEGIYEGQFQDLDAWLDEQVDTLHDPLKRQVKAFSNAFDTVQVICKTGNHGQMRASGTSKKANADLLLYKSLRNTIATLQEEAGLLENVRFRIGQAKPYINFPLRGGKLRGHVRHGHNRKPQAATSAGRKEWLSTVQDHAFDVGYMGHHHISGRLPWEGPPVLISGSPKPPDEFVESLGVKAPTRRRHFGTAHGMSDDGLTCVYPIDTRNYS